MGIWNTGARIIGNGHEFTINIVDQENPGLSIIIGPREVADWHGVIYPWCNSAHEVGTKAFHVTNAEYGTTVAYLFQDYESQEVYWSAFANEWNHRVHVADNMQSTAWHEERYDYFDIFLMPAHNVGLPKVWGLHSPNGLSDTQRLTQGKALLVEALAVDGIHV